MKPRAGNTRLAGSVYEVGRMKPLTFNFRYVLSALLCCVALAITASAQEAAPSWVSVAPQSESFTVMMPRMPFAVAEGSKSGELSEAGRHYSLRHDNAEYTVWSFKAGKLPAAPSLNTLLSSTTSTSTETA